MTISADQLKALVDRELSAIHDERVKIHIRNLLVEPYPVTRGWDYGAPDESYPCWSVLEHNKSNTSIAYCESGFGPRSPWGLVFLSNPSHMSIGMDSGWYISFLDAYFESMAASELPIWRVYKQSEGAFPGAPVTEESDWDSTWAEIMRLRSVDSTSRYHCHQDVRPLADET
jgi:hypothetical protein